MEPNPATSEGLPQPMGGKSRRRRRGSREIPLTPLIDISMQIAFILLGVTVFVAVKQGVLYVNLPQQVAGAQESAQQQRTLNLCGDGKLLLDGREVTWDTLAKELGPDEPFSVAADRDVNWGEATKFMGHLSAIGYKRFAALVETAK